MKKEIMELWVKALRSGKYQQSRGGLRSPEGSYCCLGVLAGGDSLTALNDALRLTFDGIADHIETNWERL